METCQIQASAGTIGRFMRVASVQMRVEDGSKSANLKRASDLLATIKNVDLILLPELWTVGYFSFDLYACASEELEGETVALIKQKAKEEGCYVFGGSLLERCEDKLYNTSVLVDRDGNIGGKYRKMHLFGYDSDESRILARGTELALVRTKGATFGLSTCYDLRFPELYRKLAIGGATVFLVASAWPYPRLEHWLMLNRVRALENQAFLISSNCVGINRQRQFLGHSMIVDPWGTIVASAGDLECVLRAELDLGMVEQARRDFPALHDRVIDI